MENKTKQFHAILNKIEDYDKILILRHQNPDPDAIGSQAGLGELLKNRYPEKSIKLAGKSFPDFHYIAEMDEISLEEFQESLLVITDTANRPRIDTPFPIKDNHPWIKIDHHPDDEPYGDISYVDTTASSASEIIAEMSILLGEDLPMTDAAAQVLYAGIVGDTGRFLYPSTTSKTFMIASKLVEYTFDHSDISNYMITRPIAVNRLAGYMYQEVKISVSGVASIVLTQEILKQFGVSDIQTSMLVSIPGTFEAVVCWGIFVEQASGYYRCRLRSKGPVINQVAKKHGGGGHPLAAGANAYSVEEIQEILQEFEELVERSTK